MTTSLLAVREAAAAQRAGAVERAGDRPRDRRGDPSPGAPALARVGLAQASVRAEGDEPGAQLLFDGYASVVETSYDMWDMFGPYTESVALGAFDATLSRDPDVAFLLNHKGMTLARTTSGTLRLSADDTGLRVSADLDPENSVVRDIRSAMNRRDLDQMSFAFTITRGSWSPDYMSFTIDEVDLHRGDVSVVNYGANPATTSTLRSPAVLSAIAGFGPDELARAQAGIDRRTQELGLLTRSDLAQVDALLARHRP